MKVYRTDEIRNVVLLGHGGSGKTRCKFPAGCGRFDGKIRKEDCAAFPADS